MGMPETRPSAQIAYEAYADCQGWTNYQGTPIPPWDEVRSDIQAAWVAAVYAVLAAGVPPPAAHEEVEGGLSDPMP
jgi:hypothetical protein